MSLVSNAHELKGLQVQLLKEKAACEVFKSEAALTQRKVSQSLATVKALEARISEMQQTATEPIVSEHALLRYLERVKGVNLAELREEILGEGTANSIKFAGNCRIQKGKVSLIVKDKVVVTVE